MDLRALLLSRTLSFVRQVRASVSIYNPYQVS